MSESAVLNRRCFVCDVSVLDLSNELQNTQLSGTSVFKLLEILVGHRIRHTETDIWCKECIVKIDNYDQAIFTAKQVRTELLLLLTTTVNKYNEVKIEKQKVIEAASDSNDLFNADDQNYKGHIFDENALEPSSKINTESDMFTTECDVKLLPNCQVKKLPKLLVKPTSVNRFICDLCGQSYKSKGSLEVHLNRHNGVFPHKCEICQKKFTQRGSLIRHMPLHTGEHPYQCDKCGKQFIHSSSFRMHKLVHNRERPKKCYICSMEMRSNSQLSIHMLVHSGERSHSCPTCGQKFARRCNMLVHYQAHQGIYRKRARTKKNSCPNQLKLSEHLTKDHATESTDFKPEQVISRV